VGEGSGGVGWGGGAVGVSINHAHVYIQPLAVATRAGAKGTANVDPHITVNLYCIMATHNEQDGEQRSDKLMVNHIVDWSGVWAGWAFTYRNSVVYFVHIATVNYTRWNLLT